MTRAETLRALTMQVDHGGGAFGTMPDPAAFSRAFRTRFGRSPKAHRES